MTAPPDADQQLWPAVAAQIRFIPRKSPADGALASEQREMSCRPIGFASGREGGFLQIVNQAKEHIREVTVNYVKAKLDKGEEFLLVDVREESEFAKDHLPEAIHLGKGIIERDIEQRIPDPDTPITLYCGSEFRSALAVDNLQKMGCMNVFSMDGGIREWREKKLPMAT